jgi:hypothetical protein
MYKMQINEFSFSLNQKMTFEHKSVHTEQSNKAQIFSSNEIKICGTQTNKYSWFFRLLSVLETVYRVQNERIRPYESFDAVTTRKRIVENVQVDVHASKTTESLYFTLLKSKIFPSNDSTLSHVSPSPAIRWVVGGL